MEKKKKKLIAGVGNILQQDEGVGIYFANYIRNDFPDFDIVEIENLSLFSIEEFKDRDCIIFIDAINENYTQEYIFFELNVADIPLKFSLHEVGVRELMGLLKFMDLEPRKVLVYGLRPCSLNPYVGLSKEMTRKLPHFREIFIDFLLKFGIRN